MKHTKSVKAQKLCGGGKTICLEETNLAKEHLELEIVQVKQTQT